MPWDVGSGRMLAYGPAKRGKHSNGGGGFDV